MLDIYIKSILMFIALIAVVFTFNVEAKKGEKKEKILKIVMLFEGDDDNIKKELAALAENIELTAKEFRTTSQVAYWDNEGRNLIRKLLASEGYYSPIITSIVEEEPEKHKHYTIKFDVFPASRYRLSKIEIVHSSSSNKNIKLPTIDELPTKINTPAKAEELINNQSLILDKIEKDNCLLTLSINNESIINHKDNSVEVKYLVDAGPTAKIKKVDFVKMQTVNKTYIRKVASLEEGTCFKRSKILEARKKLQSTGLFATTTPDIPSEVDEDGAVPVIFKLKERKHRSVKAGIGYGSDLGMGINLGWKHRNLFSGGEQLSADTLFNQKEQSGRVSYIEPYFLRDDQKLVGEFNAENSTYKAYDSREGKFYLGLEREMINNVDAGIGGKITVSRIKEKAISNLVSNKGENFVLLSMPVYLKFDKRDSVVDARKGYYLHGMVEPFYDVGGTNNTFVKNVLRFRYYTKLSFHKKSVIAFRARIGSIVGDNASEIPATERFYLGGMDSLRGYAYQTVGPYDINRKVPLGGKSFLTGSVEYRYMREDNLGFAIFYDVGNVYRKHAPDYKNNKMFTASGFGVRYNTDFGPIRVDIAFPLNRRKGIDDTFQFTFGIGQSF